ncbi:MULTISPECIES: DUF5703 family protein [Rothia]|uniref:Uncharacterized protein n=1 Tax=Rothia amarae TaxID=169480 RepID=A0A7H2BH96_9MICC|nr:MULTISPECIES: DUF5703 family protein [Rothia]QNV39042.1 hypothetical protein IDM48_06310 [Rothia amarae]
MREQEVGFANVRIAGKDQRFEYLTITVEPHESVKEARARVMEHSEYGRWELARSVILYGGRRRFWLRRRVIRVHKTVSFI